MELSKEDIVNIQDDEQRVKAIQDNIGLFDGTDTAKPVYSSKEDIQAIVDTDKRIQAINDNLNLFK